MFKNRIRLPLYVRQPQFPTEANRFRKADGTTKTLAVVVRKTYQMTTDFMSERLHQRLVIALNHDDVRVEGERYLGGIAVDGEYEIEWVDFLDYPLGKAVAQLEVTPFNATNDNCKTCEEMTQLDVEDDTLVGTILEGTSGTHDVFANDSICCAPVTAVITYTNPIYLANASIDSVTGIFSYDVQPTVPAVTGPPVKIATYRVTCPDGTYDEADIYAKLDGTAPSCEAPVFDLPIFSLDGETTIDWSGGVADYEYELYTCEDLGTPIDSGTVATNQKVYPAFELNPGQCYHFCVRRDCGGGSFSEWVCLEFTVPATSAESCGRFRVEANDGTLEAIAYPFSYMDCAGVIQSSSVVNLGFKNVCMLMDSNTNTPIYFAAGPHVTYIYVAPC